MSDILFNIQSIRSQIPASVKLVAVSKTKPAESILEAYNSGQRIFGENRVQEILSKKDMLPADIEWHMIGHLQSNKVKQIVPYVSMIQSVDTSRLLSVINSESQKAGRRTNCLIQIHIAEEETKTGFSPEEVNEMFASDDFRNLKDIRVCGLMGMATFTDDKNRVRKEFRYLADLFKSLKNNFFAEDPGFSEISMGMSGDYMLAIEEGSTMVRIGSLIFGERNKIK
jgi:pyridoxal phosphate enzyme (YggS family)